MGSRKLQKARREADRSPDAAGPRLGRWPGGWPGPRELEVPELGVCSPFSPLDQCSASRKLPHSSPGELRPLLGPRAVGLAWPGSRGRVTCVSCLRFPTCRGHRDCARLGWGSPGSGSAASLATARPRARQRGSGQGRTQAAASPSPWGGPPLIWVRARLGRVRRRYSSNGQIVRGGDKGHRPRAWLREGGTREAVTSRPLAPPRTLQASWVSPQPSTMPTAQGAGGGRRCHRNCC